MRFVMDSTADAFEQFARGLLGRATEQAEAEMGDPFDRRVLVSIDLAHHNEGLVGLEILCANLADYAIALSDDDRTELARFADEWRLGDSDRELVGLPQNK